MAKGDFQDYSNPSKNNFTRTIQNTQVAPQAVQSVIPTQGLATTSGAQGWQATANKYLGTQLGNRNVNGQTYFNVADGNGGMYTSTPEMQATYTANPTARLGADGTWSNSDGSAWSTPATSGAGDAGGYLGLANTGINAFNAYNSYKLGKENLGMARDKFAFEKAAANANYTNQAKLTNNQIQNAGEVGMGLAGNTMDPNARLVRQTQMDASKVRETI